MTERADLHVHFDKKNLSKLLEEAGDSQTTVLGVLEHETLRTTEHQQLIERGQDLGVRILPGVEMWFKYRQNGTVIPYELVGLDFDLRNRQIYDMLDPRGAVYSRIHQEKVKFQSELLAQMGFNMEPVIETESIWEELNSGETAATAILVCRAAVKNPENIHVIKRLRKQLAATIEEHNQRRPEDGGEMEKILYWENFALGKPGYKRWTPEQDPKEMIDAIHQAGGVVVLAHPKFQHTEGAPNPVEILENLLALGVDGLEGYNAGPLDQDLATVAKERKMLILGGSGRSYEYENRRVGLGDVNNKDMFISPVILEDLKEYKTKHGLG